MRLRFKILIKLTLVACVSFWSCAKELSDEARLQEEVERKEARLAKAAGVYRGFYETSEKKRVPVDLTVSVLANPTGGEQEPLLQASLTLGLFGGVRLSSTQSSFEWGSGRINFSFGKTEVRAVLKEKTLTEALLAAPRQGNFPLVLEKEGRSYFEKDREWALAWNTEGSLTDDETEFPADDVQLLIRALGEGTSPPLESDLPLLPRLYAVAKFENLAQTPQVATVVWYDPLEGTLEFFFTSSSKLRFEGVFGEQTASGGLDLAQALEGEIFQGAAPYFAVESRRVSPQLMKQMAPTPPHTFVGTYQGSGKAYDSIVRLESQGTTIANPVSYPFPSFPQLNLKLVVCEGGKSMKRRELNLVYLDHLHRRAGLHQLGSANDIDFIMHFSPSWEMLEGRFLYAEAGGTVPPKIEMFHEPDLGSGECAELEERRRNRR